MAYANTRNTAMMHRAMSDIIANNLTNAQIQSKSNVDVTTAKAFEQTFVEVYPFLRKADSSMGQLNRYKANRLTMLRWIMAVLIIMIIFTMGGGFWICWKFYENWRKRGSNLTPYDLIKFCITTVVLFYFFCIVIVVPFLIWIQDEIGKVKAVVPNGVWKSPQVLADYRNAIENTDEADDDNWKRCFVDNNVPTPACQRQLKDLRKTFADIATVDPDENDEFAQWRKIKASIAFMEELVSPYAGRYVAAAMSEKSMSAREILAKEVAPLLWGDGFGVQDGVEPYVSDACQTDAAKRKQAETTATKVNSSLACWKTCSGTDGSCVYSRYNPKARTCAYVKRLGQNQKAFMRSAAGNNTIQFMDPKQTWNGCESAQPAVTDAHADADTWVKYLQDNKASIVAEAVAVAKKHRFTFVLAPSVGDLTRMAARELSVDVPQGVVAEIKQIAFEADAAIKLERQKMDRFVEADELVRRVQKYPTSLTLLKGHAENLAESCYDNIRKFWDQKPHHATVGRKILRSIIITCSIMFAMILVLFGFNRYYQAQTSGGDFTMLDSTRHIALAVCAYVFVLVLCVSLFMKYKYANEYNNSVIEENAFMLRDLSTQLHNLVNTPNRLKIEKDKAYLRSLVVGCIKRYDECNAIMFGARTAMPFPWTDIVVYSLVVLVAGLAVWYIANTLTPVERIKRIKQLLVTREKINNFINPTGLDAMLLCCTDSPDTWRTMAMILAGLAVAGTLISSIQFVQSSQSMRFALYNSHMYMQSKCLT